ncbi:MAG: CheR family methyltransferase [Geobacteraceae bacterium]
MTDLKYANSAEKTLTLFSRFISRTMGLHFSSERLPDLGLKMESVCGKFAFDDSEACMLWLMSTPLSREHLEVLAGALTIGETYFFRDPHCFRALEEHVLRDLVEVRRNGDKRLRIWSAGCSSGEEPYSLAILLSRMLPDLDSWNILLLATDINPHAIDKAQQGVYGRWSFRDSPPWLMEYFKENTDRRYEIMPRIREMVQFSHLNLAEDCYPTLFSNTNALDLIFCRNVMLYFQPELINTVTAKFHHALRDDGWLFLGPTEAIQRPLQGFSRQRFSGAIGYQKSSETDVQGTSMADSMWTSPDMVPITMSTEPLPESLASVYQFQRAPGWVSEPDSGYESKAETVEETPLPRIYREACTLYETGKYELAAIKVRELLKTEETHVDALQLLAKSYANLGKFSEAVECCEMAITADRLQAQNYYLLAVILQEEGRLEEAATVLNRALYIDHDYVPAYFTLGNLCMQTGRKQEAQRNFANALRLLEKRNPNDTLPEADGLTAGRLAEIIRTISQGRAMNE